MLLLVRDPQSWDCMQPQMYIARNFARQSITMLVGLSRPCAGAQRQVEGNGRVPGSFEPIPVICSRENCMPKRNQEPKGSRDRRRTDAKHLMSLSLWHAQLELGVRILFHRGNAYAGFFIVWCTKYTARCRDCLALACRHGMKMPTLMPLVLARADQRCSP